MRHRLLGRHRERRADDEFAEGRRAGERGPGPLLAWSRKMPAFDPGLRADKRWNAGRPESRRLGRQGHPGGSGADTPAEAAGVPPPQEPGATPPGVEEAPMRFPV
jgi:hypothetical protein